MATARTSDRPAKAAAPAASPGAGAAPEGGSAPPSLPKGGGAIRGIGEKFSANPVTGTGSMTIPIATSPGRADFGPKLALAYDSGSGNGPFGLGWTLSLPAITRKTAQGLPRYRDDQESDDFILSDADDLVPLLLPDGTRPRDNAAVPGYSIRRYRPRIDTIHARIERWTRDSDGDTHWRSYSQDNILTIYGGDPESRIADPADPSRVFSWLICETRDDRGNAILYRYKPDDGAGLDLARPSERNRGAANDPRRAVNRYLKRILYANRQPLLTAAGARPHFLADLPPQQVGGVEWMFEVLFDYGEHDPANPTSAEQTAWPPRPDPFASYRSTFEVRTTRLCHRVLMFHHVPDVAGQDAGYDGVVRSVEFGYLHESQPPGPDQPGYAMLESVTQAGWRRLSAGGYLRRPLPPVEFEYTLPRIEDEVRALDAASAENLPDGIDGVRFRWVDLHGEGIAGAFAEQGSAWWYKRNLSPLTPGEVALGPLECVGSRPALALRDGAQFLDLAGDGQPDLVTMRRGRGRALRGGLGTREREVGAMSMRETAIAALHSILESALASRSPAPLVLRGETLPQRLSPGGLVVLRDGEIIEETPILSPLAWAIEHRAEVEVTVTGATPSARNALLDALLVEIGSAVVADRTLGGAVEWAQPGAPEFQDVEFEGAAAARAALLPVTLSFTAAGSPLA
ncbi:hypothetical protein J4558_06845 [Leptolyngbya sp. 15MV]|nr:hypothetical protein J4558_06845 [Leptolyngbya sp. 15MV]